MRKLGRGDIGMVRKGFWRQFRNDRVLWLMVLPTLIVLFMFNYLPLVGIYLAFTRFNFRGGFFGSPFIGLENFRFLAFFGSLSGMERRQPEAGRERKRNNRARRRAKD